MIYFKENCDFPRFQRGPTFSSWGGGSNVLQGVQLFPGGGGGGGPNANFYRDPYKL